MIQTKLEVAVDDTVGRHKFARLNHLFASPMRVLEGPVRELVQEAMHLQFSTEGDWGGTPWQELAQSTIRERERLGYGGEHSILIRSGRLYEAFQGKMSGGSGGMITVSANEFVLTTVNIPDAAAHQRGSEHSNLPARPIIPEPFPQPFIVALRSIVQGYVIKARLGGVD